MFREIRLPPPAKQVNFINCAEQSLNVFYHWEWTQVPTGFHKAPLLYAFFCHGYATMNKTFGHVRPGRGEDWCVSSFGAMASPCGEMYVPAVAAQRELTGTPLRVLGVKASGGKCLVPTWTHMHICKHMLNFRCVWEYTHFAVQYTHMEMHKQKPGAKWVQSGPWGACPLPVAPADSTQWELRG